MAAALGAAVLLITRTFEPRKLYEEMDRGLLVFFVELFLIIGGAQNAGIVEKFLGIAEHWNLHKLGIFTVAVSLLSNIVSNVPAVMLLVAGAESCESAHCVACAGDCFDAGGESDDHGKHGEYHCGRECQAGDEDRVPGIFPRWAADYRDDVERGMGVAGVGSIDRRVLSAKLANGRRTERRQNVIADSESWRALFRARIRSGLRAWDYSHAVGRPEIRHEDRRTNGDANHARRHHCRSAVDSPPSRYAVRAV